MANKITYVDELDASKDYVNMKVRIIHRWSKPWFGINMILIDEKGKKIQANVKKELMPKFDEQIKVDRVVLIKKFGVGKFEDSFRVVIGDLRMNFYRSTEVCPEVSFSGSLYGFNFVPFNEITKEKAEDKDVLNVDVMGSVMHTGNLDIFKSARGKESKRFNFELKDLEGRLLKCTMWDDYAVQFSNFVQNYHSTEHIIVIIQHALIKVWDKEVTVQSDRYGTRLFINEEIQEADDFRRSLIVKEGNAATSTTILGTQTVYPYREEFLEKHQRKHVDEIRETEEVMECVVVGEIKMLEPEYGWFYVACRKCKNKKVLTKSEYLAEVAEEYVTEDVINAPTNSLWCLKEHKQATQFCPKFKVSVRVQDSTGSVSFCMFDRDVSGIIGLSANDIRERQLQVNDTDTFPHELDGLLNKVFAFIIKISPYNLRNKRYSVYTVQKVCDDPTILAELAKKAAVNEVSQDTQNAGTSTVKLSESSQGGLDSKDAFFVTADSFAVDLEKDTETSPLQKRVNDTPGAESTTRSSKRVRKMVIPTDV